MFDNINRILKKDNNFTINIFEKGLYVYNYKKIFVLAENEIELSLFDKIVNIKGTDLKIIKMLKEELLVSGKINSVTLKAYE